MINKKVSRLVPPMLLGLACIAFAAVSTDYDHKADFARYHTYSWMGVKASNSLWEDRIRAAVDNQLGAKGWSKVASGGDVAVASLGRTTERDTMETFYDGFPGWGWRGWGGGLGTATTTTIPERVGTLTVDLFDGSTKKLIWRGNASDTLSDKPDKNDQKMEHAVADMFKHFPPHSKD